MTVSGWVGYGIWFACAIGLEKLADLTPVATGTGAAIAGLTGFMSFMRDNAVTSGNADRIMVVEYTAILFDKGITDSDDDLSG